MFVLQGLNRIVQCHSLREDIFKSLRQGMILRVVGVTCQAASTRSNLYSSAGGWDTEGSCSDSDGGDSVMEGGGDDFAKGDFVEGDFETEERFADGEDESSPEEDERAEERCRTPVGGDFVKITTVHVSKLHQVVLGR